MAKERSVSITVTSRELTVIRSACFRRLDQLRAMMRAEHITRAGLHELSKSYDDIHTLLQEKLL